MFKTKPILFALTTAFLLVTACGEPEHWHAGAWQAVIPLDNVHPSAMAASTRGVYFVDRTGAHNTVYEYADGKITEAYVGSSDIQLCDVAAYGNDVWAGGESDRGAFLVHLEDGVWRAVVDGDGTYSYFLHVAAAGPGTCWLVSKKGAEYGLVKYAGNELTAYPAAGNPIAITSAGEGRYIYAVDLGGRIISSSFDGGATWGADKIEWGVPGAALGSVRELSAAGENLYMVASFKNAGADAFGVIKREGNPGAGKYEPIFYSFQGPYISGLASISFPRDDTGVATGENATVFFTGGTPYLEEVPMANFYLVTADPKGGWWAFMDPHNGGPITLMHHD